jgi:hypothetical protein
LGHDQSREESNAMNVHENNYLRTIVARVKEVEYALAKSESVNDSHIPKTIYATIDEIINDLRFLIDGKLNVRS